MTSFGWRVHEFIQMTSIRWLHSGDFIQMKSFRWVQSDELTQLNFIWMTSSAWLHLNEIIWTTSSDWSHLNEFMNSPAEWLHLNDFIWMKSSESMNSPAELASRGPELGKARSSSRPRTRQGPVLAQAQSLPRPGACQGPELAKARSLPSPKACQGPQHDVSILGRHWCSLFFFNCRFNRISVKILKNPVLLVKKNNGIVQSKTYKNSRNLRKNGQTTKVSGINAQKWQKPS